MPRPDPEIEVVLAAYEAFARGDVAAATADMDPEVEWIEPLSFPRRRAAGRPGGGRRVPRGLAGGLEAPDLGADRDRVGPEIVVVHRLHGILLDGTPREAEVADVFRFREGRIGRMRAYEAPEEAFAAAPLRRWIDGYREAWESNDPDGDRERSSPSTASTRLEPWETWSGREEIVAGWLEHADKPGDTELPLVARRPRRRPLDRSRRAPGTTASASDYANLWLVELDDEGRARGFSGGSRKLSSSRGFEPLGEAAFEAGLQRLLVAVAGARLVEAHRRRAAVEVKGRDLVVEAGAVAEPPADPRVLGAGRLRQRRRHLGEGPREPGFDHPLLFARERVAVRRADGLVDRRLAVRLARPASRPRRGRRGGRPRPAPRPRRAWPPRRPGGDVAEQVAQRPEGVGEAAPVVEVDGPPQLLRLAAPPASPWAPSQTFSFQASSRSRPGERSQGTVVATSRWSKSPSVWATIHSHSSSSTIRRAPSSSTRPARESTKTARVPLRSRQKLQRAPAPVDSIRSAQSKSTSSACWLPRTAW